MKNFHHLLSALLIINAHATFSMDRNTYLETGEKTCYVWSQREQEEALRMLREQEKILRALSTHSSAQELKLYHIEEWSKSIQERVDNILPITCQTITLGAIVGVSIATLIIAARALI